MVDSGVKFAKKVHENVIMQLIIKQFCTFNLRALILNKIYCHCKKKLNSTTIVSLHFMAVGTGGQGRRLTPPPSDFGRLFTLSQSGVGGSLLPHITTCLPPRIFRPSYGHERRRILASFARY